MPYIRETCVAGRTIETEKKYSSRYNLGSSKRAPNTKATPEDVMRVNERNAEKSLRRILNHNFMTGDLHLVLTYSGEEPSQEQAKQDLDVFKRKLAKLFRKQEKTLKWVAVTEYKHKRIHHHIVCSSIDIRELIAIWPHGHIRPSFLDNTGNYRKLAAYLIKETSKTFRDVDSISKRRYSCSRTIEKPEVKREIIPSKEWTEEPQPIKGYYIDQDTVREGIHELTGYPYQEYIMVSMDPEPRITKWDKGRIKYRRRAKSERGQAHGENISTAQEQ